jgi:hypothetical protein
MRSHMLRANDEVAAALGEVAELQAALRGDDAPGRLRCQGGVEADLVEQDCLDELRLGQGSGDLGNSSPAKATLPSGTAQTSPVKRSEVKAASSSSPNPCEVAEAVMAQRRWLEARVSS